MKHKQKIYPAHPCVSCLATTTNRTFCDACQKILKHPVGSSRCLEKTA